jgi:hypothetical protein
MNSLKMRVVIGLTFVLVSLNLPLYAQQQSAGTSSRQFRDEALAAIPLRELSTSAQQRVSEILNKSSIYRRLPRMTIEVDPDYFLVLQRYPEIVVEIWRLMNVTEMTTERVEPFVLSSDDGAGTISRCELVYGTEQLHLFIGEGTYEGSLIKRPIQGECVILVRSETKTLASGAPSVSCVLDVFVKIDNAAAGMVAKTIQPIIGRTADHNFVETMRFVQRLNETTQRNGPGVQGMAYKLTGLSNEVRQLFIETAGLVYQRYSQLNTSGVYGDPAGGANLVPVTSNRASATEASGSAPTYRFNGR